MSKASYFAEMLKQGKTIEKYKEAGNSMMPIIKSRQPVTLEPVNSETKLEVGSIVFCKVKGNFYTHKITKIKGNKFLISNNKGHDNGWVSRNAIFGIVTKIHKD